MNNIKLPKAGLLLIMVSALFTFSCSDTLEVETKGVLSPDQHYRDIFDANAAVLGIYGELTELAPQYVALNELRADLMSVTVNADHYMRQIASHTVTADNPWADPQPFFSLINNCNDVMKNLTSMYQENKISREEYNPRYSDIGAVRSWAFLQLAIHYGQVPYITEPIDKLEDIKTIERGDFPFLDINTMVDSLVNFMESVPYKGRYTDENLLLSNDGFSPIISYIDKEYLLGILHLWNDDYLIAADYFKKIMERQEGDYDNYKIPTDFFSFSHYHSGYQRFFDNDIESVINHWGLMFSSYGSADYYDEWIWVMYYSSDYMPSPFIDIFSNQYGNYYFKPSEYIIDKWESQVQQNGFTGDFRGDIEDEDGFSGSYKTINGQPVITKFISDFNEMEPFDEAGKWFLWRAPGLHLNFIEAANRYAGNVNIDSLKADRWETNTDVAIYKVAYSLLNNGFRPNFENDDPGNDYTVRHHTPDMLSGTPFEFDARSTSINDNPPTVRALWYRNEGIRNRAYLQNIPLLPEGEDSLKYQNNLVEYLEDKIIEEGALELAFEGLRWGDLVRISLRRNDPMFLANKIADKLAAEGNPDAEMVRAKLSSFENWWLPLK